MLSSAVLDPTPIDCTSLAAPAALDFPEWQFQTLYDYWRGKHAKAVLPGRQHIQPEEIVRVLPHLVLYDVIRDGTGYDFRARLVGTAFSELLGRNITGRLLSEVADPVSYAGLRRRLAEAVECRVPVTGISRVHHPERSFLTFSHLTLPLARDGRTVDMLLGARLWLRQKE